MKIKNIFRSTLLVVLTVIAFSSCDERYYWSEGTLDRQSAFRTDASGQVHSYFRVDWRDIYTEGYGSMDGIRYLGYEEVILRVNNSDEIDEIWLNVAGTDVELGYWRIRGRQSFYGSAESYFMEVVIDQIKRHGYVDINVDAYSKYRNMDIGIQLLADVEVYLRD